MDLGIMCNLDYDDYIFNKKEKAFNLRANDYKYSGALIKCVFKANLLPKGANVVYGQYDAP